MYCEDVLYHVYFVHYFIYNYYHGDSAFSIFLSNWWKIDSKEYKSLSLPGMKKFWKFTGYSECISLSQVAATETYTQASHLLEGLL